MRISLLTTSGEDPGWIYRHQAVLISEDEIGVINSLTMDDIRSFHWEHGSGASDEVFESWMDEHGKRPGRWKFCLSRNEWVHVESRKRKAPCE